MECVLAIGVLTGKRDRTWTHAFEYNEPGDVALTPMPTSSKNRGL